MPGRGDLPPLLDRGSCLCYAFPPVTQILLGLAQQTPASGGPGGVLQGLLPMVLIIGVMYLIVLRPQMRKQKEVQRMLSELKKGDDVVTTGGIVGKISGIKDDEVTLQVQEGVRLRVLRSAVAGRHKAGEAKTDPKASS
jgi:preprotein translocase subunit YajC